MTVVKVYSLKTQILTLDIKLNVTPLSRRGSNLFFAALYCSCLELNALFALPRYKGGNKGSNFKEGGQQGIQFKAGAINCCYENKNITQ